MDNFEWADGYVLLLLYPLHSTSYPNEKNKKKEKEKKREKERRKNERR